MTWPPSEDTYQAAITNGTAPGLYVREGDDTSDWETYRQVLARRVEEAMAARRGGAGEVSQPRQAIGMLSDGREVVDPTAGHVVPESPPNNEIRVGDVVEVVSCGGCATMPRDVGCRGTVSKIETRASGTPCVCLEYITNHRLPLDNVASLVDVRKVTSSPSSHVQPPMPLSRPAPQPAPPQPSSPSRFSLLEIDVDASPSPPQAPKASVDLAALQAELRAEREAKRALAAAQTPQGRFDLLECDLAVPAVAVKPIKTPRRPVVSSSPPKPLSPVETITDLTAARSPLELARILAGLNEELSTMMRQREAN